MAHPRCALEVAENHSRPGEDQEVVGDHVHVNYPLAVDEC